MRHADIVLTAAGARLSVRADAATGDARHDLGADGPGKCEVDARVIREAVLVCDDRELAVQMGAVGAAGLGHDAIDAELGEVLAGIHPGRTSRADITVYGGVGLAFQDLLVAWQIYRHATARQVGRAVDFLA